MLDRILHYSNKIVISSDLNTTLSENRWGLSDSSLNWLINHISTNSFSICIECIWVDLLSWFALESTHVAVAIMPMSRPRFVNLRWSPPTLTSRWCNNHVTFWVDLRWVQPTLISCECHHNVMVPWFVFTCFAEITTRWFTYAWLGGGWSLYQVDLIK